MYAKNITTFLQHLVNDGSIALDLEDEITRGALLTHENRIVNEAVESRAQAARAAS